jgi:hypothetical protein
MLRRGFSGDFSGAAKIARVSEKKRASRLANRSGDDQVVRHEPSADQGDPLALEQLFALV